MSSDGSMIERTSIWEYLLVGFGGLCLASLMLGSLALGPIMSQMRLAQSEAAIKAMPERSAMLSALRKNFPDDYAQVENAVRAADRSGLPPEVARDRADATITMIVQAKQRLAVNASDEKLAAIAKPQLAYFEYLQRRDVKICADYAISGLTARDRAILYGSRGADLDQAVAVAMLEAAADAVSNNRPARTTVISLNTANVLVAQLRRDGTSPAILALIQSAQGLFGAPPAQMCAGGVAIARALTSVPPAAAAEYYRSIFGRIATPRPAY